MSFNHTTCSPGKTSFRKYINESLYCEKNILKSLMEEDDIFRIELVDKQSISEL